MTMAPGGGVLVVAIALVGSLTAGGGTRASHQDATAALVERGGRYAEAYHRDFSAVVSEELKIQELLRVDGGGGRPASRNPTFCWSGLAQW